MNDDFSTNFITVLFVAVVFFIFTTVYIHNKNNDMQNFYDCVRSDIESKRYSTIDSIECHCNTILKTEYGNTCK